MKTIKKISVLSILFMVMVACNTKDKEDHSKHNKSAATTFYTCSMDPQVKEDKPGKCPICHMELTPIKQDDTEANEISLSKQQIQLGNITTQTIYETQSSLEQNYTGVLAINQEKIKTISARAMGRIEKLYFKTVGDYVAKNQAVYQLYSEDIAIAKQDYFTAYKQLAMPGDFGKNARNMLNASEISTTEGNYAMEGSSIIKLADLNSLWLETQVNVNYAKNLKIGQKAQITFSDFPDKTINAQVSFINPEINPDTRLLLIRLEISNPNLQLKPGMQAMAKLTQSNLKGLYFPVDAVIREENASYIWVEKRPGVFENVMVETGIETNGMIEIKSEIDPAKKVVITGAYAINSEYKFRKGSDPMEGMKM